MKTSTTKASVVLLALLATSGCGKEKAPTPASSPAKSAEQVAIDKENQQVAPPKPTRPTTSENDVDLTFEGAFSAKLSGKAGSCSLRQSGPIPGATWQVRSEELGATPTFDFTILSEEASFDDPTIIVNVKGDQRASYARHRGKPDKRLTLAKDGTSAEVDVQLKGVAVPGELHVVGTIKCPKPQISK